MTDPVARPTAPPATKSFYDSVDKAEDINDAKYDAFRRHEVPWTHPLEILKTIVTACLLPLRIIYGIWWLALYGFFVQVGKMSEKDPDGPPTKAGRFWASGVLDVLSWLGGFKMTDWFTFTLGYPFIRSFGDHSMYCKETGKKANLIVANHSSYLDIFLLMTASEEVPGFVAKSEVKKVPLFGWISRFWRCIYVNRTTAVGGPSVTDQISERAENVAFPPVVIFPEGTTTNNRFILPFKRGAFVGGHPVKPVAIKYPHKRFSPAWESCKFPYHVLRMFTQFYNECEIYWLPVYTPNEAEKKDPVLFAQNVRDALMQVAGFEDCNSSLADKIAYLKAIRGEFDAE